MIGSPVLRLLLIVLATFTPQTIAYADDWKAGTAQVNITPKQFMWMSGYGGRNKPADGKLTDLWAKALVVEDPAGERVAVVTLDLVGIDRELSLEVRAQLEKRFGLTKRQVALFCSHTHTGPVVGTNLKAMYALDDVQWKRVADYTAQLKSDVVGVVGEAIEQLAPSTLSWDIGQASFAVNRRNNKEADVPKLRKAGQLKGPVDHDVPVLRVSGGDGKLKAVVFGYACHATVLSFYQWSGDYPGFAQIELEKSHPGAVALFWAGCGADQNPLPRRKVGLAQQYGRRLATAVDKVLAGKMKPVTGRVATAYDEIDLKFAALPSRKEIETNAKSTDRFEAGRARVLLERIRRDGQLSRTYPYPIQTWRLGPDLLFVTLGGEVVVDYSLRLKQMLGPKTTWVAGYTNDVMAYIPSRRVLAEGGYEGGTSMRYYGQPSFWAPEIEADIVRTARKQAEAVRASSR